MSNNYLDIIRPGINTTFQDKGRDHLYHIGIPFSGAMDNRNYLLANKLVNNKSDSAVIEFAYQGPHLKYSGEKINFAVTGDAIFLIKKKSTFIPSFVSACACDFTNGETFVFVFCRHINKTLKAYF